MNEQRTYGDVVAHSHGLDGAPKLRGPALTLFLALTRARALMARPWSARCYGVARQRDGSRQNSIGGHRVNHFH
jgi:hypothetical protein